MPIPYPPRRHSYKPRLSRRPIGRWRDASVSHAPRPCHSRESGRTYSPSRHARESGNLPPSPSPARGEAQGIAARRGLR